MSSQLSIKIGGCEAAPPTLPEWATLAPGCGYRRRIDPVIGGPEALTLVDDTLAQRGVRRPVTWHANTDDRTQDEEAIEDVATRARLGPEDYETAVVVDDDIEAATLDTIVRFDTVCVGLSERNQASRIEFGTMAARISHEAMGNVGIVRGPAVDTDSARNQPEERDSK